MANDELGPNPANDPLSMLDYAETVIDPDLAVPGLMVVDGDDLPDDRELGHQVRSKLMLPAGYVKPSTLKPRRVVVVDRSRPDKVPEILKDVTGDLRREWIGDCETDITVNLLNAPDDADLGEMVRKRLLEDEEVHNPDYYPAGGEDSDEPHFVPGFYDPSDHNERKVGEQRAWVVVGGS